MYIQYECVLGKDRKSALLQQQLFMEGRTRYRLYMDSCS